MFICPLWSRSLELLFGTHTYHFNCFFEDFNCVFTQIRCLSRVLILCFSSSVFFVLVNDLYIGDPLEANKTQEICYSIKTLLMNTLSSGRINPSPAVCKNAHVPTLHFKNCGMVFLQLFVQALVSTWPTCTHPQLEILNSIITQLSKSTAALACETQV